MKPAPGRKNDGRSRPDAERNDEFETGILESGPENRTGRISRVVRFSLWTEGRRLTAFFCIQAGTRMKKQHRTIMFALLYVGGGYLALIGILYILQDKLLYHPSAHLSGTPSAFQVEWEDVYFETGDGLRLHGWYLPHEESEYVVIFTHGNGGNLSDRLQLLDWMNESGISVFIYDYRGYGKSEGTPTEKGLYQDIEAAWRYLTRDRSYDPSRIILFGRSLGGPVSAYLAQQVDAGGLVLESTFTNLKDIASEAYPIVPTRLVRPKFPTLDYLSQSTAPVMIMHSREDPLIGFHHGRELYEKAPEPKTFVELRGGHNNNFVESREVYFRAWKEFISNLAVPQ